MISAFYYTGRSLGPTGTVLVVTAVVLRVGWMFWRRRNRL